jgi:pheromone shutdown-related protein TraB
MKYKNLIIVGTSHIARQSIDEVTKTIEEDAPEIIALELDKGRLVGLLSEKKHNPRLRDIQRVGLKGFLFSVIGGYIENKLGEYVGVKPGEEMMTAYRLAQKNKKRVALIDQDIQITLKRFSKAFTWKEKWHLFVDILKGTFSKKERIKVDLTKVPSKEFIAKMIGQVKKRYPSLYKVLIQERNEVMAKNLFHLMRTFPEEKIMAVMGAGHEKEIVDLIKREEKKFNQK